MVKESPEEKLLRERLENLEQKYKEDFLPNQEGKSIEKVEKRELISSPEIKKPTRKPSKPLIPKKPLNSSLLKPFTSPRKPLPSPKKFISSPKKPLSPPPKKQFILKKPSAPPKKSPPFPIQKPFSSIQESINLPPSKPISPLKKSLIPIKKTLGIAKNLIKPVPSSSEKSTDSFKPIELKSIKSKKIGETEKILENYNVEVDKARVRVEIRKGISGIIYKLYVPEIGLATSSLLSEIRSELVSVTAIAMKEILDPTSFNTIKKRFTEQASSILKKRLPTIKQGMHDFFVGKLIQDMLGLGEIEFLVSDPNLEEVIIPSSKEFVRVYHKKYGWLITNLKIASEEEIINYSNIIARRVGRQITVLTPLLDAHLITGDRVNSVLYPISTKGNTITIRKFARDPLTIVDLINNNTCSLDAVALLWLAIEFEMNILISGGTASGKTSFLNACIPFMPPNHRIITVEDTRELMLPKYLYWTPLVTRTPNPEGKGEVSMLDLLINSLRMRPDRIILGEMRRQKEAEVLFEAMHTGHSVYATVHADTATETISRLTNPPLNVPPNLLKSVNLNVVMFRDRRKGVRRVFQIAEFELSSNKVKANILYRWIPEEDKIVKHSESSRFFEDVSRNTGMSSKALKEDSVEKKMILSWMIKNKIRNLTDFGRVMNLYYTSKELLLDAIKKNDVKKVLGKSAEEK